MSKIKFYEDSAKTNQVYPELDPEEMARKANIDGYYEEMTVGAADNLTGRGDGVPASFLYRTAGGDEDIADGIATITSIKGNTIVWNQLIKNGNFAYLTNWTIRRNNGTINNNILTMTSTSDSSSTQFRCSIPWIVGHKYYISCEAKSDNENNTMRIRASKDWSTATANIQEFTSSISLTSSWQRVSNIITLDSRNTYEYLLWGGTSYENDVRYFKNAMLIDLTQMFGSGNEPSTPEEFEELFPLDYYDYNAGSLLNFTGSDLKTIGFNQWDEDWEAGSIYAETGENQNGSNIGIRSKNYIKIFPNTNYFITYNGAKLRFYDINKNYIGADPISYTNYDNGKIFKTPMNTYYFRFATQPAYGSTYKNDICLNLSWSGYRNGEYEQYWEQTRDLPINEYFPNGMKKIIPQNYINADRLKKLSIAYDEITPDYAIQRMGGGTFNSIDSLKALVGSTNNVTSVNYSSTTGLMRYQLNNCLNLAASHSSTNWRIVNTDFGATFCEAGANNNVEGVGLNNNSATVAEIDIYILVSKLENYPGNNSEKLNAYLSEHPITIEFELATPIETRFEESINLNYKVSDFGIEQILPENTSTPTTSAFNGNILYGMNAVDTLRRLPINYVSKDSMDNFLGELGDSTQSNWTATYNENTGEYDYETDLDLTQKANIDGYYEEMTVGAADNLTGKGTGVPATFTFRTAGGNEDIADGVATINTLNGNTLVWNQYIEMINKTSSTTHGFAQWDEFSIDTAEKTVRCWCNGSRDYTIGVRYQGIPYRLLSENHKYYIAATMKEFSLTPTNNEWRVNANLDFVTAADEPVFNPDGEALQAGKRYSSFFTVYSNNESLNYGGVPRVTFKMLPGKGEKYVENDYWTMENPICIDLTTMFGAGNEPSTIEEFESLFPLDWYDYNEGSFLNYTATSLKTVGFNQWDEEWETGTISAATGENVSDTTAIRSKNYIPVFPNTIYATTYTDTIKGRLYDINKKYIGSINGTGASNFRRIMMPANAHYFRFATQPAYGGTYKNDICINLSWSGYRDGEYEPYWSREKSFDFNAQFPDGIKTVWSFNNYNLNGNKNIFSDEIKNNMYIQKVGKYIFTGAEGLNNQESRYDDSTTFMVAILNLQSTLGKTSHGQRGFWFNKFQHCYQTQTTGEGGVNKKPFMANIHPDTQYSYAVYMRFPYSIATGLSYESTSAEKEQAAQQWLQNQYNNNDPVIMYYELAEYIETPIDPSLNLSYKVSDFGTEEMLPENTSAPNSSPFNGDIIYGMNAVDTLRRLPESYISEESMSAFLSILNNVTQGTWAMEYNSETGKYEFSFTPGSEGGGGN